VTGDGRGVDGTRQATARYLATMTSPDGEYDAYGRGGLASQNAARKWIAEQFAADPDAAEGAIYLDVAAHEQCGGTFGCDGHLVAQIRREGT
jgi:hypothetical protein